MDLPLYFLTFLVSFLFYLAVDLIWLRYVAGPFYRRELSTLLSEEPRMLPALLFYVLFVFGNILLVVEPALFRDSLRMLLFRGGFYGLVCYATYDLTNLATLDKWTIKVSLVDMTWGVCISMAISLVGFYFATTAPSLL
ncbi:MAG: DUF2177 family protein [bacterium]